MCGIVGYIGSHDASTELLQGLSKLEYRGYDSAGLVTLAGSPARTQLRRAVGKVSALQEVTRAHPPFGRIGIAHTRWATHGAPRVENAHPHHIDGVSVIHNGIFENARVLRAELEAEGCVFHSQTDTEVLAHLVARERARGASLMHALRVALARVEGTWAVCVLDEGHPDRIAFARRGSPLVLARGEGGLFLASDALAVLHAAREVLYLLDGDVGEASVGGVVIEDERGAQVVRPWVMPEAEAAAVERGRFSHFMRKEMEEQPRAVADTLAAARNAAGGAELPGLEREKLAAIDRVVLVGCGSSYHACLVGARAIEQETGLSVAVDLASEWRFRDARVDQHTLVLGVSQSGETADTLGALEEASRRGAVIAGITNVRGSAIARACRSSGGAFVTRAGPEIGVASTKAFLTQIVALRALSVMLAVLQRRMTEEEASAALDFTALSADAMRAVLDQEERIRAVAHKLTQAKSMLYLGRGALCAVALEGALKMTEISYIHAQGFASGEMKHGPIALIEKGTPVVVLAPRDKLQAKVLGNLEEVRARGAHVVAVIEDGDAQAARLAADVLEVPAGLKGIEAALVMTVPLQLLAYHVATLRGLDVDMPRNLAKSVTVE